MFDFLFFLIPFVPSTKFNEEILLFLKIFNNAHLYQSYNQQLNIISLNKFNSLSNLYMNFIFAFFSFLSYWLYCLPI